MMGLPCHAVPGLGMQPTAVRVMLCWAKISEGEADGAFWPSGPWWSHPCVQQWQSLSLYADQRCPRCSWSDSDWSWSKCLRGIRGISSKIPTWHQQPIPEVEYCCRRKVWLLGLCKIMFLGHYFKTYKEAWNSPQIPLWKVYCFSSFDPVRFRGVIFSLEVYHTMGFILP